MKTLRTIREVRRELAGSGRVGLVPTMGAFHEGHLALFRAAREECEVVVVSLFVNPTQFGRGRRPVALPRDEARDAQVAEAAGVDILFAPSVEEMYPDGYATWVDVEQTGAEGDARPGHFRGVATVCLKLFNIVRPAGRVLRPEGRAAGCRPAPDGPRPGRRSRPSRPADRP